MLLFTYHVSTQRLLASVSAGAVKYLRLVPRNLTHVGLFTIDRALRKNARDELVRRGAAVEVAHFAVAVLDFETVANGQSLVDDAVAEEAAAHTRRVSCWRSN